MEKKVAAVIVTHNRLSDLKLCINSVKEQSIQSLDIIVVNNGSTDGTKEYLEGLSDVITINQDNLGGAGGFYSGQKYMYDNGYEWIWMMDDDGIADKNQLKTLLNYSKKSGRLFLNALVASINDPTMMAFYKGHPIAYYQAYEIWEGDIHPFNGTLIHRTVIEQVGFIKKEMFIWGDEKEYKLRIKKAGYTPTTVTNAIHYHPEEKGIWKTVWPGWINKKILTKPKQLSKYYYRNLGYINKTYLRAYPRLCKDVRHYSLFFVRTLHFGELLKFLYYYNKGVNNNYK
ncbi:MAG: glycosyltransferase [Bacteroidales bacterium]|nr:glycosyltransferase [Bacteroidales bacterium]